MLVVTAIILATVSATFGAAMSARAEAPAAAIVAAAPRLPSAQQTVLAEHRCLTEALYYEARSEGVKGEKAVAEVVFHRLNSGRYGQSICAVVYEGADQKVCQFSFTCNGDMDRPREIVAWNQAEELAAQIFTGEVRLRNFTGGATSYHANYVKPYWAPTLERTTQIGKHIFYRGRSGES